MSSQIVSLLAMASSQALIQQVIYFIVAALVLYVVYWAASKFGTPAPIQEGLGIICLLVLIVCALKIFGIWS